jgi:RimJ/RimL family protein N-acetyltransferase
VPADRDPALAFATTTFDGWDYIAEVWDRWTADRDGAFLVAVAQAAPDGTPPEDRVGRLLAPGQVVAITHLDRVSPTEGWVEGIRVDPAVRGMDVATDLQAEVLRWAADLGMTVVRYVTSASNEGSLRLAARVGLLPVARYRFHGRGNEDDRTGPAGRASVEALLASVARDGTLLPSDADAAAWFARIATDPTFRAGHGLYEHRSWAYQALTPEALADRIRDGEVLVSGSGPGAGSPWAMLIVNRPTSLEDGELWPALLVGDGAATVRLLERLGGEPGPLARMRLPDPAPLREGFEAEWDRLGYRAHEGRMVVVEKRLA